MNNNIGVSSDVADILSKLDFPYEILAENNGLVAITIQNPGGSKQNNILPELMSHSYMASDHQTEYLLEIHSPQFDFGTDHIIGSPSLKKFDLSGVKKELWYIDFCPSSSSYVLSNGDVLGDLTNENHCRGLIFLEAQKAGHSDVTLDLVDRLFNPVETKLLDIYNIVNRTV